MNKNAIMIHVRTDVDDEDVLDITVAIVPFDESISVHILHLMTVEPRAVEVDENTYAVIIIRPSYIPAEVIPDVVYSQLEDGIRLSPVMFKSCMVPDEIARRTFK